MSTEPGEVTCPECGSSRLHGSLRHWSGGSRDRATPMQYFAWLCRACGATWAEPTLDMDPIIEVDHDRNPDNPD